MNLENIREFLVLADTGNYEEAAFNLFTTQSTLSKHIIALENQLGGRPLFSRGRGSTELTSYGERFYMYASKMLDLYDEFVNSTNNVSKDSRTIHIGYAAGMDSYGFFETIKDFCNEHPDLGVFLEDERVAAKLRLGDIDIGILFEDPDTFDRNTVLLFKDRLVPIVSAKHPLASKKSINLNELKDESFILFSARLFLHKQCQAFCRQHGFIPHVVHQIEGASCSMITTFVAQNLGVSLVPEMEARFWANDNFVILEPDINYPLSICLQYEKQHILSDAEKSFISYMQEKTKEFAK